MQWKKSFPQQQILYTAVQTKPPIWQEIQLILAFIHSLNRALKRRVCYSFALSKAVLKCLFLIEQETDTRRKQAVSEEQNSWQMGQEQQLCSQKTQTSLHTWGCHVETSQEMVHNEGKRDCFWQQVSGCCSPEPLQWMLQIDVSSGREKVSINNGAAPVRDSPRNIMKRYWSLLQCDHHTQENSPTCPRPSWATSAPSQAWISLAAPCPWAHQEHIFPTTYTRDVQKENQKVTHPGLYPCCEADPCAGMTKEDWTRAARAQRDWNQTSHLTDKWPDFRVLITHHFVQPIQKAAPHLLCESGKGLLLDLLNCVMERATDALSLLKCYRDKVRVSAASWKQS